MVNQYDLQRQAGESKSQGKVDTGNGARDQESAGSAPTAGSLPRSARKGKQSIAPEQALEILQTAIIEAKRAGIDVKVVPVHGIKGIDDSICVMVKGVTFKDGNLILEADDAGDS